MEIDNNYYSRFINAFGIETQLRIKNISVLVIGMQGVLILN